MIAQILSDIEHLKSLGNTINHIVLAHLDYNEAFEELKTGESFQDILGYQTTVTSNNQSYILFTCEEGEQHHFHIGYSKPEQVGCE